jgi:hypothetical protein
MSFSSSRRAFLTSRPESKNLETVKKTQALHRHYLSMHIQEETKKRDRLTKTMEKLSRKEILEKKIKEEIEAKKLDEEKRREALEQRIRSLVTHTKEKNQKTRSISPKLKENKELLSSKFSYKLNQSTDFENIQARLNSFHEKLDKSNDLHQQALKEKTYKVSYHTQKVNHMLSNLLLTKNQSNDDRVQKFVSKLAGVETRKKKNANEIHEKIKKTQEKQTDKQLKIQQNLAEELKKEEKRIRKIEEKMNSTLQNIREKSKEMRFERELKIEKFKLKEEDTLENVTRMKKAELKKKLKILEKHQELDKRLEILKEERDKDNEKIRDDAHKTVLEKAKLKDLKILVEKTQDSSKLQKILKKFYDQSDNFSKESEDGLIKENA